jgi:pimeloyl-ACP methyl ester carboxylesterase
MESLIEHSTRFAGHSTRVLELPGSDPGVVLLHGWGDSADTWRPLLAELAASGRRAIAADLPGFGAASRLAPGAILPQLDAFAVALVQEWGEGRPVVLAGSSLGGDVALRLAGHDGLRLAGVVPVSPAGLESTGWFDAVERDPIVRRLLDLPIPVPNALVRDLVVDHEPRALIPEPLPELEHAPFDLASALCPVVLVWGSRDRAVPHRSKRVALGALPAMRVALIEDCGRAPQRDAAAELLELVLAVG